MTVKIGKVELVKRSPRAMLYGATLISVMATLSGVSWWTLFIAGAQWAIPIVTLGTVFFGVLGVVGVAFAAFPPFMVIPNVRQRDWVAVIGDTVFGVVWVFFTCAVLGNLLRMILALVGIADPARSQIVAVAAGTATLLTLPWGCFEAFRVPRVRRVQVTLSRLGQALDGTRVVLLTDTHYGPIDRTRWSAAVVAVVNDLDADIVCHAGDIADGSVSRRREQAAPLGDVRATLALACVTGNHEYFGVAQQWFDHMQELGWQPLHNRHIVVERGGDRLVVAGIDDLTAASSGQAGHQADLSAALAGTDSHLPVLLLAHQPKQIESAVVHSVDLQLSGHTHGGQIWPFHYLVRADQPALRGLTRHGLHTQLYTSRGAGFWGPPLRIFAPSEITLLTLRAAVAPTCLPGMGDDSLVL